MTPPKKKADASGGAGKHAASGPKRSAGTKGGKTTAGKSSGRKSPARKDEGEKPGSRPPAPRRPKRSKKKRNPAEYVALAFFFGLLAASLCFVFLLRPEGDPSGQGKPGGKNPARPAVAAAQQSSSGPLPKIPADLAREAARKAQAAKQAEAAKAAAKAKTAAPGRAPGGATDKAVTAEQGGALSSALIDLKALPYEESLSPNLDERIRQVDYAIMQAAWLRKLPAAAMRLVRVEDRLEGTEAYQYQVIEILPGKSASGYLKALRECLSAWAAGARLDKDGRDQWAVTLKGVHTHRVRLFPDRDAFPPSPEITASHEPFPPESKHFGSARVRKPGEAAKLVIVVDDMGANVAALNSLLALDYPVTLAFWPHGAYTRKGAQAAGRAGREILIHQPMEPMGYPKVKPGPNVLLTSMHADRIRRTLEESIGEVPHAVGLNNHMGSRFTQSDAGVDAVIGVLREKGLFMLDSITHAGSVFLKRARAEGLEHYGRDVFLDVVAKRENVLAQLRQAERIALLKGQAVAIGHPLPETLAALKEWQRLRNRQVRIVKLRDLEQD
jgi:polysaccharide deacetylase 2 family uncharacterized protein YibQ